MMGEPKRWYCSKCRDGHLASRDEVCMRESVATLVPASDRQGRVAMPAADVLVFVETGAKVSARLGVIEVGEITINPAGMRAEYIFSCHLPMTRRMVPAINLEKAKGGLAFVVRNWLDAAGVVVSAAALARLQGKK